MILIFTKAGEKKKKTELKVNVCISSGEDCFKRLDKKMVAGVKEQKRGKERKEEGRDAAGHLFEQKYLCQRSLWWEVIILTKHSYALQRRRKEESRESKQLGWTSI